MSGASERGAAALEFAIVVPALGLLIAMTIGTARVWYAHTVVELGVGHGDGEARYAGRGMDGSRFERRSTSLRFERKFEEGVLRHAIPEEFR